MVQSSSSFPRNIPVLDGKNWSRWHIQMRTLFGCHEVWKVVQEWLDSMLIGVTEEQQELLVKKDCRALSLIHQAVDNPHFERIAGASTSKEAWEILVNHYAGAPQLRKVKLQAMKRQYGMMIMQEDETVAEFINRVVTLTNAMKACGEKMDEVELVEKILRSLKPMYDHIVYAIEEGGRSERVNLERLQGSLEAYEQNAMKDLLHTYSKKEEDSKIFMFFRSIK